MLIVIYIVIYMKISNQGCNCEKSEEQFVAKNDHGGLQKAFKAPGSKLPGFGKLTTLCQKFVKTCQTVGTHTHHLYIKQKHVSDCQAGQVTITCQRATGHPKTVAGRGEICKFGFDAFAPEHIFEVWWTGVVRP